MDDGFSPQLTSFSYADGSITNGGLSHHRGETPTTGVKPTKLYYPPMTSYIQTYAQRTPTVQHLMLYLLQITKFIPETFSSSSKLIEINSELSKNVPLTFKFLKSFRNYSETSKMFLNYLEIFRNTSLSSEILPSAQSHRNNPKTAENTSK